MADKLEEAARSFDAYEVLSLITPGAVVALLALVERPELRALLGQEGLSLGDFGVFVIAAFVLGHLTQAVAVILEPVIWLPNGLPTNWLRDAKQRLVTANQRRDLHAKVVRMEGADVSLDDFDRAGWRAVTTRAYGQVRAAGRSGRIDTFNKTYGMARGLVAAVAICLVGYALLHPHDYRGLCLGGAALVAAILRMRYAGQHYARALILEFIDLPAQVRRPKQAAK